MIEVLRNMRQLMTNKCWYAFHSDKFMALGIDEVLPNLLGSALWASTEDLEVAERVQTAIYQTGGEVSDRWEQREPNGDGGMGYVVDMIDTAMRKVSN